jgi:glucose-6-phosphate isomerase
MNDRRTWERFKKHLCDLPSLGLSLDISRMNFPADLFSRMAPAMQSAFDAMQRLEAGAIANPDENRMVGHYWLRAPELAPSPEIARDIIDTRRAVKRFAAAIHAGRIRPQKRRQFTQVLSIGIGGSALGPQFVADALGSKRDKLEVHFLDNTDPDGFDRVFFRIGKDLASTLTIVISKSGGTIETRNGMLEIMRLYKKAGLSFEKHAVSITGVGSNLYNQAIREKWISIFPMWDWVGGRTSITSAVGLLPMAIQGIDIERFIEGARLCDEATRHKTILSNPAALLALMWHHATDGTGSKDMVILPYKDRLQLFTKYLQQLIMESIGKEKDLAGKIVNQGISVFGNKGTTDQHAYVQQLRDGVNNFFVTFIEVQTDRDGRSPQVDRGATSGDYLSSFLRGTRDALSEKNRESMTIAVRRLDARSLGAIIALYERAVGLYAALVNINAYHQPGVEAGKKMAGSVIELQRKLIAHLRQHRLRAFSIDELAAACSGDSETVFHILEHMSANRDHSIVRTAGRRPFESRYASRR